MSNRPPVADWASDFDHLDPNWVEDPFPIWNELRGKCPIAQTDRFSGVYFPSRYDDIRAIAYGTEHFSSRRIIIREERPPRHAAFGLGIHHSIGSTLARMEIRVALEEWLARFPDFALKPGAAIKWSAGTVRGPRQLPIALGPRRGRR